VKYDKTTRSAIASSAAALGVGVAEHETFHGAITASHHLDPALLSTTEHKRTMAKSAALTADLGALSSDLDQSGDDLHGQLQRLALQVHELVPSYVGLSTTTVVDNFPLTMTIMDESVDPAEIAASATLPLSIIDCDTQGQIVFYATRPGAFVDFAADARSLLVGVALDKILLDQRLSLPSNLADASSVNGLADFSTINQAYGVLIEQGHTPEDAHTELFGIAADAGVTEAVTAQRLLAAVAR
jgi:hypothetical protein